MKIIVLLFHFISFISACENKSLLFSDDFESHESGKAPGLPWKTEGNGKIFIDNLKSKSGKQSVHFISGETYENRALLGLFERNIFPLKQNSFYGSMNMWIDEASPDGVHWTMIQSSGKVLG